MSFKNVHSFFVIFLFLFSIFFPINSVFSNAGLCLGADYCTLTGELGTCNQNPSADQWCDCGSSDYSCDRPSTDKECRGAYGNSQNAYCFPGETCNCTAPPPIPGCTNPLADNYNPSATTDNGSCVFSQPIGWYNLNFNVRDQNNSPRRDALVTIGQNFGNGTTRYTDGAGFANFGIPQNNTVNYTVSASNCNTVNGSRFVGTADQTVSISLNCSDPGSGPPPPPPGPQPAVGVVESANCTAITGYAGDPDNWNTEIGVYLFRGNTFQAGGTYVADVKTNIYRADVNANYGVTGNHGFSIPYPDSLRDNVARNFYVHPRDLGDTGPFTRLYYPSWGVNNVITLQCPPIPTVPATNNVSISAPVVIPNGSTQYTISHTGSDVGGSAKITYQYALLRDDTGANKGWFAWNNAIDPWSSHKNAMACTGGGYGAILSSGGWAGYGDQFVRLISCNTSTSGNTRTTNFVMVFEPTYTTTLINNDIYGITYNTNNNTSPWEHFDVNFGLNMPSLNSITITPSPVTANNSTQHTISVVGRDPTSGANVTQLYALANQSGTYVGQYRGYLTWGISDWWPSDKNHIACTGGGWAVIQSTGGNTGFGHGYVNLDSCSTTVSGNNRTANFVVRYDPSFTTPTTNNLYSGHVFNGYGHPSGWTPGVLFNLNVPVAPTVTSPTVSGISTTGATLGANVTSLGNPASITARGTCWGAANPPLTNCTAASGLTTGVYTHARTGMTAGTTYYYRGYATNSTGTGYSAVSSFTTTAAPAPTLSASPSSVAPNGNVSVTFTNIPTPTVRDWVGMYVLGNTGNSFVAGSEGWKYVGATPCTQTVPGSSRDNNTASPCTFTLPATPGNYNFRMWDNDNILVPHGVSNTVTVTAPATYLLIVAANPGPGGRITGTGINCGADCSESVSAGANITLTAVPASSYWRFTGWGGACSGTSTTCNLTVNANTNVTATFVPRAFIYREF